MSGGDGVKLLRLATAISRKKKREKQEEREERAQEQK
jgi:hypothetical protein